MYMGVALCSPNVTITAQPVAPQLQVIEDATGIRLTFAGSGATAWPSVDLDGMLIPAQLVAVALDDTATGKPSSVSFACRAWSGQFTPSARTIPQANGQERPDLAAHVPQQLPTAPITLLREGRSRGQRIGVLVVASIIEREGRPCQLTRLHATIPGAQLLDEQATTRTTWKPSGVLPTSNPAASGPALMIDVRKEGMQYISGAALLRTLPGSLTLDPARLHLERDGQEIALQLIGTEDGRLDDGDELRFYAPAPGDRWNQTDTYWLTFEDTPGQRMATSDARPGTAPLRTTAQDAGTWQPRTRYDSTLPGPDGDHWFAAELRRSPGQEGAAITIPVTTTLPRAVGPVTITITGSAYTAGTHQLHLRAGTATTSMHWDGTGDWTQTVTLEMDATSVEVALLAGAAADGIALDAVEWTRPVALDVDMEGARFRGEPGRWRYQLQGVRDDQALYDVTDPEQPVEIALKGGSFEDGPAARQYVLTGSTTLHTPDVQLHTPIDLLTPREADAVYVAPRRFHAALEPLIEHRRHQGYAVDLIAVEDIYATWSFGQVEPEAIRRFIQHAAATWARPPQALVLVGDGTSDPQNYLGRNNTNHIPPYLAMVDPWLGETACEPCYGQLDGDDPLDDPLPDLAVGRLPVKSEAELAALIQKLMRYDTSPAGGSWGGRAVYVADNVDGAGDFAAFAELSVAEQPEGMEIQRVYYAPSLDARPMSGRVKDAREARARTLAALNQGAGLVNYIGHSHTWQWAVTDPAVTPSYLLGLYDVDALTNGDKLPIVLEMTCLTSAFQQPAYSGTTLDERLVLHPGGGAIATWGPTGLGIAHGHDALQRGFYRALWNRPAGTVTLGELTLAGYRELFMRGSCCQDTLRTFALLGDPLTRARVQPLSRVWMPGVGR
jgi:hypothetical protein